jgi:hypothetical protein
VLPFPTVAPPRYCPDRLLALASSAIQPAGTLQAAQPLLMQGPKCLPPFSRVAMLCCRSQLERLLCDAGRRGAGVFAADRWWPAAGHCGVRCDLGRGRRGAVCSHAPGIPARRGRRQTHPEVSAVLLCSSLQMSLHMRCSLIVSCMLRQPTCILQGQRRVCGAGVCAVSSLAGHHRRRGDCGCM